MSTNRPAQIFEAMHDLVHVYRARMMEVVASIHSELTYNEVRALLFVGRHPGATQKELVQHASAGKRVVRLKGGDPFIFGRGGEELDAARDAGVPCEVVPGITAAAGCAAQAGLPLTHREDASAVSFVEGQCKDLSDQDWSGLAGHGRTLVIYMGLATASAIADKLIADGVSPDLPVAVIERGTTADARVLRTLLTDLGDLVSREAVKSPALIIVGKVAARADALDCLGAPGVAEKLGNFA